MHFEILVEGQCELTTLSILLSKFLGAYKDPHSWKIHKHQGIGSIPANLININQKDRSLLGQLPFKLKAYSITSNAELVVIVLLDLDGSNQADYLEQLNALIPENNTVPIKFFFAIEELEAWFLGDVDAFTSAYPIHNKHNYDLYQQDSICGTWEIMAKILNSSIFSYPKRDRRVLAEKCNWAKNIAPLMNIEKNKSPSFQLLKDYLKSFN